MKGELKSVRVDLESYKWFGCEFEWIEVVLLIMAMCVCVCVGFSTS